MKIVEHTFSHKQAFTKRSNTTEIILHCEATTEGTDHDVQTVDKWHKARGFNCIGYHFCIALDGTIHRGRPEGVVGAHCSGHNAVSIGISYVGGMDKWNQHAKDTRTDAQKKALLELVHYLMNKYKISLDNVHGHYEFAPKACPSFRMETERVKVYEPDYYEGKMLMHTLKGKRVPVYTSETREVKGFKDEYRETYGA